MTEDRVRPGDRLGRYELLARVGRGGMATVWAARHHGAHGFSKIVALKTMLPELSDDADFQRMFLAEARLAARIHHPNVIETLDLGEEDGLLYIVMEWTDGETLAAIMRSGFERGGVPLAIALKVFVEACAGAHAAHELRDDDDRPMGLVHRDVSPPNVLVSFGGLVKLADFGVAKTLELNGGGTLAGQVKGKLRYMAPEQLLGAPVDRRADVFALGISLYQLTTRRHPWPGDTAAVTVRRVLSEAATPPASFVDGYSPALESIVLRALSRHPADRFQSAAELGLALEDFARSVDAVATTRDVSRYMNDVLGPKGAARRAALRVAIREADARTGGDARPEVRRIDETWDGAPDEIEPAAGPGVQIAEVLSVRPWSTSRSVTRDERGGDTHRQPDTVAIEVSRIGALAHPASKRALWIGAFFTVLSGAYAVGRHPGKTADASVLDLPSAVPVLAGPNTVAAAECAASPEALVSSVPPSAPSAIESRANPIKLAPPRVRREIVKPVATVGAPKKATGAPHAAPASSMSEPAAVRDSEPDVGF